MDHGNVMRFGKNNSWKLRVHVRAPQKKFVNSFLVRARGLRAANAFFVLDLLAFVPSLQVIL